MNTEKISVDARGLSCPQPVMLAHRAIQAGVFPVEVLVDTVTARENVRRMAEYRGCQVTVQESGGEFRLILTNNAGDQ